MDEAVGAPAANGASRATGPVTVLGVDPTGQRAIAELPRWVPAAATALYRIHPDDHPAAIDVDPRANPPGLLLAIPRRIRGARFDPTTLTAAVDAAGGECDIPVRVLERHSARPAAPRSRWWTVGAWMATALGVGALVAGTLFALTGTLLVVSLAVLLVIGAAALLVGFALAHEAAEIRRADASIAALIADGVGGSERRPVVVLPTRNAAGVAAVLREHGIDAENRIVASGLEPDPEA